jgi:hypothetical protein
MSTTIEVTGGLTVEQAAAKAGANIRQQAEARKFALHTKAVCMADRVVIQFALTSMREMQMAATYYNGKRMTDRTITTWLPSGTLLDVYSA